MRSHTHSERRDRLVAGGLIALLAALWSVTEILPSFLSTGYSLYQVVWMRYGTHLACLLLVLLPRQGLSMFHTRRPLMQIGRGLLMLTMPLSFILSIGRADAGDVLAIFWLTPLLILGLAAVIERDRAGWQRWLAAGASVVGALSILRPDGQIFNAVLFGLGMGASFSLYTVLTRTLRHERTSTNLLYSALVVFVPLTLALPLFWQMPTPRDALLMAGVGVTGLGVLWALDRACELVPVSAFVPVLALQVVLMNVVAPLLAGGHPAKLALAGAALILGSAGIGVFLPIKRTSAQGGPGIPAIQVKTP